PLNGLASIWKLSNPWVVHPAPLGGDRMPTNRTYLRRPRRNRLSGNQELELWLGPSHHGPTFQNEEERRASWFRHRDRLMAMFGQSGRRPLAWWEFEAPIPYPGYDDEEAALYEAGLLGEQEAVMQVQQWRIAFDRAQAPGFAFCLGHRKPSDMFASW